MLLLAGIVVSTFVTIVIKVFGLIIIFSADGVLNTTLMNLGLIERAYSIIGTQEGIVVGGGVSLMVAAKSLEKTKGANSDQDAGRR